MADKTRELNEFLRKGYNVAYEWRLGNMRWLGVQFGYFDYADESIYVGVSVGIVGIVLQLTVHVLHTKVL